MKKKPELWHLTDLESNLPSAANGLVILNKSLSVSGPVLPIIKLMEKHIFRRVIIRIRDRLGEVPGMVDPHYMVLWSSSLSP